MSDEKEKVMKSINLAVIVSSVMLLASGFAVAESAYDKNISNQNFSKRPYHAAPQENAYKADDQWEGATLRDGDAVEESAAARKTSNTHKQLRLNSLGKRPYME
jgi:hypothetical protein